MNVKPDDFENTIGPLELSIASYNGT